MIRFRFTEDERRFIRLHAEMFEKLARVGLSEVVGSDTLRNVSKIEQMAFMEGIRQGLAMASIAREMVDAGFEMSAEPYAQKAFQLHAVIYGSSDTPLRSVEKEWLDKLNLDADHFSKSWLDDKPMRFAPSTLQELDGTTPPIAPMISVQAAYKPTPVKKALTAQESADAAFASFMPRPDVVPLPPPEAMHGAEVTVPEPWQKGEYEPYDQDDGSDIRMPHLIRHESDEGEEEVRPESPEFLDIARSAIQTMQRGGWDPKTWNDLILGLHRHMHVDAGFLDLQLTTHVGRTVLDQCGLAGMAPPEMVDFKFLSESPKT